MNPKFLSWAALGVSLVALVLVLVGGNNQSVELGAGTRFPNGISADSTAPAVGEVRGTSLNFVSTATTSVSLKSTSSTQGVCMPFNATSTNTLLNMTFGATSSATTVGVEPIIRYGACN